MRPLNPFKSVNATPDSWGVEVTLSELVPAGGEHSWLTMKTHVSFGHQIVSCLSGSRGLGLNPVSLALDLIELSLLLIFRAGYFH